MSILFTHSILAASLAGLAVPAASDGIPDGATEGSTTYLEFAVYKVQDAENFSALREAATTPMAVEPGFIWWHRLKTNDGLFADILAWSTAESAQAAAEKVQHDEAYAPFFGALAEMVHFGHYRAPANEATIARWLGGGPEIEIALYTVKDAAAHRQIRTKIYDGLRERDGFLGGIYLESDSVELGFGDLLTWRDAAAFEETGPAMQAIPELAPFFKGVDSLPVFSLFRRDPASLK